MIKTNRNIIFILGILFSVQIIAQVIDQPEYLTTKSGLKYYISKQGEGEKPESGDRVWVHYIGKLLNDSIFENTLESGVKDFYLGQGQLIKAWEEGLLLLKAGGSMVMEVPPELGYGNAEHNGVKSNSTLVFEITLVQIDKGEDVKPFNVKNLNKKTTNDGISYYIVKNGEGKLAELGDNAYVHYTGYLSDGSIFYSSFKKGKPIRITVGGGQVVKGWDMGMELMQQGSKFRFVIPFDLAYGTDGFKNVIPPNEEITLDVEMVKLTPEILVSKWVAEDSDTLETETGLRYIVVKEGEGPQINFENIVEVHYTGYFNDGTMFDSSVKREEPIKIPVGVGVVIDAWDEGLQLMKKGAKFQFLVPSKLAYGEKGAPPQIPANADLIFDIEVLDVIQ